MKSERSSYKKPIIETKRIRIKKAALKIIQKLKELRRGKIKSLILIIRGINQLPKPPKDEGITIKKIITRACCVKIEL